MPVPVAVPVMAVSMGVAPGAMVEVSLIEPDSLPVPAVVSCRLPPPHAAIVQTASEPRIHEARLISTSLFTKVSQPDHHPKIEQP